MEQYSCLPVFLDDHVADLYYNGFANSIIWPLFHYQGGINFDEAFWEAYQEANQKFAQVVSHHAKVCFCYVWR